MYEDKTLICKECGGEFVFTSGEQEFYAEKGFVNEPQRCKSCRDSRKKAGRTEREMFEAVCASCGGEAKVPFRPREDRPVYCSECFAKMKEEQPDNSSQSYSKNSSRNYSDNSSRNYSDNSSRNYSGNSSQDYGTSR